MGKPSLLAKAAGDVASGYASAILKMSSLKYHTLMLLPLFLALMMAGGSMFLKFDNQPEDLWLQKDDWSLRDRDFRHRMYEYAREENAVITAENEGDNILTKKHINTLFDLYEDIMNIEVTAQSPNGSTVTLTTPDLCLPSNVTAHIEHLPKKPSCLVSSVLAYWDYNRLLLDLDKDLFKTVSKSHTDPKTGGPMFRDQVIGGLTVVNGTVTGVKAAKMWFYINYSYNITNAWPNYLEDVVEPWEAKFLEILQDYTPGLAVYRHSERSDGDEMEKAFNHDVPFIGFAIGIIILVLLGYVTFWPARAPLRILTRLTRAGVAFFCIISTMTACMGIVGISKLPFNGVVWYMLTFVIIQITHHIAVITSVVNNEMPSQENFKKVAKSVLPPMSFTTIPFAFVYIFVAATPQVSLPGLSASCIAGGFGLLVGHLLVCTSYLCAAAASFRATPEVRKEGFADPKESTPLLSDTTVAQQSGFYTFSEAFFSSMIPKVILSLAILSLFGVGIYGAVQFEQQDTEAGVYPASSYLHKFFVVEDRYFGTIGVPCDVLIGEIDYTDPENGKKLVRLAEDLLASGLFQPIPIEHYSWYSAFLNHLVQKKLIQPGEYPPPDKFYSWFTMWPMEIEFYINILPDDAAFQLEPVKNFTTTRFQALSNNINDMRNQSHLAETLEAIAKNHTSGDFKPMVYAPPLYIFRQYQTVLDATKFMVMITAVACTIAVLAIDWKSAGLSLFAVSTVAVSTFGILMHFVGISVDSTSIIQLSFVVPLALDLIVHTAYAIRTKEVTQVAQPKSKVQAPEGEFVEAPQLKSGSVAASAFAHGSGVASLFCVCISTIVAFLALMGLAVSPVVVIFAQTVLYIVGVGGLCLLGVACILSGFNGKRSGEYAEFQ